MHHKWGSITRSKVISQVLRSRFIRLAIQYHRNVRKISGMFTLIEIFGGFLLDSKTFPGLLVWEHRFTSFNEKLCIRGSQSVLPKQYMNCIWIDYELYMNCRPLSEACTYCSVGPSGWFIRHRARGRLLSARIQTPAKRPSLYKWQYDSENCSGIRDTEPNSSQGE